MDGARGFNAGSREGLYLKYSVGGILREGGQEEKNSKETPITVEGGYIYDVTKVGVWLLSVWLQSAEGPGSGDV